MVRVTWFSLWLSTLVAAALWGAEQSNPRPEREALSPGRVRILQVADRPAPRGRAISNEAATRWPLIDGYCDPNQIVYDKECFERYLSFYENRPRICGSGPSCEMTIGGMPIRFRSGIDYGHIGTRFHVDHLRRFLRSRIDGTKAVFSDDRRPRLSPFERDVYYCVGLIRDAKARDALPELTELLTDRSSYVRIATIWAIRDFGPEAAGSAVKLAAVLETDLASEASKAMAAIGEPAISLLTQRVNAGGTDVRIYSIEALGTIGPPARSSVDELIKALYEKRDVRDRSGYISSYAAVALGRIQDPRALPHLRKMATAKNHDVRQASHRAIRSIERRSAPTPQ